MNLVYILQQTCKYDIIMSIFVVEEKSCEMLGKCPKCKSARGRRRESQ